MRYDGQLQRRHSGKSACRAEAVIAIDRLVALRAALAATDEDFHSNTLAR